MGMYAILDGQVVARILGTSSGRCLAGKTAVKLRDQLVQPGDVYEGGCFYRDGARVLTALEEAYRRIEALDAAAADQAAALAAIYEGVT